MKSRSRVTVSTLTNHIARTVSVSLPPRSFGLDLVWGTECSSGSLISTFPPPPQHSFRTTTTTTPPDSSIVPTTVPRISGLVATVLGPRFYVWVGEGSPRDALESEGCVGPTCPLSTGLPDPYTFGRPGRSGKKKRSSPAPVDPDVSTPYARASAPHLPRARVGGASLTPPAAMANVSANGTSTGGVLTHSNRIHFWAEALSVRTSLTYTFSKWRSNPPRIASPRKKEVEWEIPLTNQSSGL